MSFCHHYTTPGTRGIEEEIRIEGDNSWRRTVNHTNSKKVNVYPGRSAGKSESVTTGERNVAE